MKKKMPRAFNRKLKREYQKGYAQRSNRSKKYIGWLRKHDANSTSD